MRAVFTIELPEEKGTYPDDETIVELIRGFGWELRDMRSITHEDIRTILSAQRPGSIEKRKEEVPARPSEVETTKDLIPIPLEGIGDIQAQYKRIAGVLFEEMPETAVAVRGAVIFVGYIASEQTLFVVTRMVPGQITFRLLHRELRILQSSTERVLLSLLSTRLKDRPLTVANRRVSVYERNLAHVIIIGRVITNPIRETFRSNLKDALLFLIPLGLFISTIFALYSTRAGQYPIWYGILERFNTALLITSVVSALGLFHTWWHIKKGRRIEWSVSTVKSRERLEA